MLARRCPSLVLALALALVLGAASALAGCGASKPASAPPSSAPPGDLGIDLANVRAQLPPYLDSLGGGVAGRGLSGYVLVAQHDQPIYSHGFGRADRAADRAPTADTSFRVGSVTKQFTATAILRLEQDGKLAVTDTVGKHLPDYSGPGRNVTIHQLLTHTSGIPSFTSDPALLARKAERFTVSDLLALFSQKPLEFPPGTRYAYSNSGYAVLGAIIERASGMPYARYLEETLFRPAGMARTVVGDALGVADRAEGYQLEDGEVVPADPIDMSLPYAAGAVRSTANDLVRWHRALAGDRILGAAARAKLYRVERDSYAYGWVATEVKGRRTVWHNGGIDGFNTTYWRIPEADLVVVAWSNVFPTDIDAIGRSAIEAALGGALIPVPAAAPADAAALARIAGTFELTDETRAQLAVQKLPQEVIDSVASIELTAAPHGLVLKPVGQGAVELLPQADGTYYAEALGVRLRAELPASGPAASVVLEQGPLRIGYRRR